MATPALAVAATKAAPSVGEALLVPQVRRRAAGGRREQQEREAADRERRA
jgi:hypothetical protein